MTRRTLKRKRLWTWTCAALLLAAIGFADIGVIETWHHVHDSGSGNDYGRDVAIDSQGAVITVGYVALPTPSFGDADAYIVKRDGHGALVWDHLIDNPASAGSASESDDRFYAVCVDSQDNIYATGQYSGDFGTQGYDFALLLAKYTPQGALDWQNVVDHPDHGGEAVGFAVTVDASDNVYVAGRVYGDDPTEQYMWSLWKFDPAGNLQPGFPWYHNHGTVSGLMDAAFCVAVDHEGGIIVGGTIGGLGPGFGDFIDRNWHVRKWSADGTLQWEDTADAQRLTDLATAATTDANGDVYVAGSMNVGHSNAFPNWDGFARKYAKDGGTIWQTRMGYTDHPFHDVEIGPEDTIWLLGEHTGSGAVASRIEVRHATTGNLLDARIFELNDDLLLRRFDRRDGVYATTGRTHNGTNYDVYTARFGPPPPPPPNTPPTIDQPPQADVDLAATGENVGFGVAASDDDDDPLTITWDFGDGSVGNGASPSHAYATSGAFMVTVTVTDGEDPVVAQLEVEVGQPLTAPSIKSKLNFRKASKDKVTFRCGLPLSADFDPEGKALEVDLDGVLRAFVLSGNGKAKTDTGKAKLKYKKKKGYWLLTVVLKKSDVAAEWADAGLDNETVKRVLRTLKCSARIGPLRCAHLTDVLYTAKQGRWGKTK